MAMRSHTLTPTREAGLAEAVAELNEGIADRNRQADEFNIRISAQNAMAKAWNDANPTQPQKPIYPEKILEAVIDPDQYFADAIDRVMDSYAQQKAERIIDKAIAKLVTLPPGQQKTILDLIGMGYVSDLPPAAAMEVMKGMGYDKLTSLSRADQDQLLNMLNG